MKKIVLSVILIFSLFIIIFKKTDKKVEAKDNKNISIIIEKEDGNVKVSSFPDKEEYEYLKTECNKNDVTNINSTFDKENWKLKINANSNTKIDGNFNCAVYFKEKTGIIASKLIKEKYKEGNTEGLIKLEQPATSQTQAQAEYRYSGSASAVKNYVTFNDETWRIIGVFNTDDGSGKTSERLKLIREESIGNYSWDSSSSSINSGNGVNQWGETTKSDGTTYEGADLMRLLNPGYSGTNGSLYWNKTSGTCYNDQSNRTTSCDFTSSGLSEKSKKMLDESKWNLAASGFSEVTTQNMYVSERSTSIPPVDEGLSITKTNNWTGKVGLMNASDYGYASSSCYNKVPLFSSIVVDYGASSCTSSNWMFNSSYQWLFVPYLSSSSIALRVGNSGRVSDSYMYISNGVRPVIYLKSGVKITSGTGASSDPYQFS